MRSHRTQARDPAPFALSDSQLRTLMSVAGTVPPHRRSWLVQTVLAEASFTNFDLNAAISLALDRLHVRSAAE